MLFSIPSELCFGFPNPVNDFIQILIRIPSESYWEFFPNVQDFIRIMCRITSVRIQESLFRIPLEPCSDFPQNLLHNFVSMLFRIILKISSKFHPGLPADISRKKSSASSRFIFSWNSLKSSYNDSYNNFHVGLLLEFSQQFLPEFSLGFSRAPPGQFSWFFIK